MQKRKYTLKIPPKPLANRIEENSIPVTESGCWIWTGFTRAGYGRMAIGSRIDGSNSCIDAHRASYMAFIGEIPEGMHVLHKCDTTSCVNPSHLFIGTHDDNMKDKVKKGRQPIWRGVNSGSAKLTECQIFEIRDSTEPLSVLAEKYNTSKTNVSDIRRRRTWTHI